MICALGAPAPVMVKNQSPNFLEILENLEILEIHLMSRLCPPPRGRFREEKRTQTQTFLVRIFSGGLGIFHVKGWGPQSSVCPSKFRETKLFGLPRDIPGFCRAIPGNPQSLRKKIWVQFSFPRGGEMFLFDLWRTRTRQATGSLLLEALPLWEGTSMR